MAVGAGAVAGLAAWWCVSSSLSERPIIPVRVTARILPAGDAATELQAGESIYVESPATRYAQALQENNFDAVIDMTWWMHERLRFSETSLTPPQSLAGVRGELAAGLRRTIEGNRLRPEGIEDQYIFAPGVELDVVAADAGRNDLVKPAAERVWFRVTYPFAARAPRDEAGRPIRSLVAGVNVSQDGWILKAGVLGNLEIDWDWVSVDWVRGKEDGYGASQMSQVQ
jgi:hypothetical protein